MPAYPTVAWAILPTAGASLRTSTIGLSDGPHRHPCYRARVEAALIEPRSDAPAGDLSGGAPPLHARWLGRVDYAEAHALQKRLVDDRASGTIGDQLLLLEHPPVLTLGRQSDPVHILATDAELAARGIAGFTDMLKHYEAHAPLKRNVLPDELGATGTFLASDGAAAITGQVIYVDAGYQIMGM